MLSGRGLFVGTTLVQKSPTKCGVSECNSGTSAMSRPRIEQGYCPQEKQNAVLMCCTIISCILRDLGKTQNVLCQGS